MRILITGGAGFIGSRLGEYFINQGHKVFIGTRNEEKLLSWIPNAKLRKITFDDDISLSAACKGIEIIIHAAGLNANECKKDPEFAKTFNGIFTEQLVNVALESGVEKFIFLSTAHIYRNPLQGLINEETSPENNHPYATSNLCGEKAVLKIGNSSKLKVNVFRLSNIFGKPVHQDVNCWSLVVQDLCKCAVLQKQMILKNPFEIRDFLGISTLCEVINCFCVDHKIKFIEGLFNIGSGRSISVLEIAKIIQSRCIKLLSFKPKILNKKTSKEPKDFTYSIDKLLSYGIQFKSNEFINEIDELLLFCSSNFMIIKNNK